MQRFSIVTCLLVAACLLGSAQAQSYPSFIAALNAPNYSRLKSVVDLLGLSKTFSNPALKVTVFVPNNGAFSTAEKRTGINMAALQTQKQLMQQVVYYHIVKGVVKAPLPAQKFPTFLTNQFLTGAGMTVKGVGSQANIVQANVQCGAGVAQGIDNILLFIQLGSLGGR